MFRKKTDYDALKKFLIDLSDDEYKHVEGFISIKRKELKDISNFNSIISDKTWIEVQKLPAGILSDDEIVGTDSKFMQSVAKTRSKAKEASTSLTVKTEDAEKAKTSDETVRVISLGGSPKR